MKTLTVLAIFILSQAAMAADKGFIKIFDGKSLKGWAVVPKNRTADWSVEKGLLVGHTKGKHSDLIYKDRKLRDYELKLTYRLRTKGNSGIHIRGRLGESKTHAVKGYHADFGHVGIGPQVLGAWDFHGVNRGSYLVRRGLQVRIDKAGKKHFTKIKNALTASDVKPRGKQWNKVHVIVKGYTMSFSINGKVASTVIDNEPAKRIPDGVIGLQVHGGPAMRIEFREVLLKKK